ncbi:MAG: hypothetical protein QGH59_02545, partial [Gemmatimonadota bacterium]|jgi:hypothetical protein|nr:hypothetical protein [Gemmatimonadota bacterium]
VGDFTAALYTYHGFFPTPACVSPGGSVPTLTYPALSAHGASLRGPLGPGIAWAETGLYDSRDDRDGTDPFVPNSSARWLAGYEVPLSTDFNLTLQYYGERQLDYDAYLAHLDGAVPDDEDYTLLTARAEKWLRYQTVRLSLFAFHSPTVEETHIRALASVKLSDEIEAALGAGLFAGDYARGRFSRFDDNDHVFLRFRYGF